MNVLDRIDEHIIIRDTIGYKGLNKVPLENLHEVMPFLKICHNYMKMDRILNQTKSDGSVN